MPLPQINNAELLHAAASHAAQTLPTFRVVTKRLPLCIKVHTPAPRCTMAGVGPAVYGPVPSKQCPSSSAAPHTVLSNAPPLALPTSCKNAARTMMPGRAGTTENNAKMELKFRAASDCA